MGAENNYVGVDLMNCSLYLPGTNDELLSAKDLLKVARNSKLTDVEISREGWPFENNCTHSPNVPGVKMDLPEEDWRKVIKEMDVAGVRV